MPAPSDLPPDALAALPYWPVIRQAARNHWTTQKLWQGIEATTARWGLIGPGPTVRGISQLRGLAGGIQTAAERLEAAADSKRLLSEMVTRAPWARPLSQQRANREYHAYFQHTVEDNSGQQRTVWRAVTDIHRLPRTVGELRDLVEGAAEQLADDYDESHVGVGTIQLLAV